MAMIIGSGAGAGLIAMKLVKAGIPTTILEKGPYFEPEDLIKDCTKDKIYDITTEENTLIPVIGSVNAVDNVERFEIDADICEGISQFSQIAKDKSLKVTVADTAIDALGKEYIQAGFDYALTILNNVEDIEVVAKDGNIVGVKYVKDGHERMKYSKTVILATDALDSAKLLKDVGIETESIKYNPCVKVTATLRKTELKNDFPAITQIKGSGFTLYPYVLDDEGKIITILVESDTQEEATLDGEGNIAAKSNEALDKGIDAVKEILEGMKAKDIAIGEIAPMNSKGSATIGNVVNDNLETSIKGLHVCDSSLSATDISVMNLSEKLADFLEDTDYDNNQFGKSDYGLGKSYGKMDGWWREPPKE